MSYAKTILSAYLLLPACLFAQTGSTCATAIPLIIDGVIRNYSSSSYSAGYLLCTGTGNSPITWFQFTTDASAQCPLLNITTSDNQACEIGLYASCAGGIISGSSMCFYDGVGLWAPAETFTVSANTVYYLRIKTSTACTISISGQHYNPPNDNCSGAFPIGTTNINDNNACHHGGPGVLTSQLCAFSLENTAFYQFYVATTGYSIINISNISCDNQANNNNNGFQIGFFTGNCSSLTWLNCTSGSGSFVQATTPSLTAGTKVYVAIDGNAGSNCSYSIGGINIVSVLSEGFMNFSGWQKENSNVIKWTKFNEIPGWYEIERSGNGSDFYSIGKVNAVAGRETITYSFEDKAPSIKSFYRLRQTDASGKTALSNVIKIERKSVANLKVVVTNPARNFLNMTITVNTSGNFDCSILNTQGIVAANTSFYCMKGTNRFSQEISRLPSGQYYLLLKNKDAVCTASFIKVN
jgi:hypothetical protein